MFSFDNLSKEFNAAIYTAHIRGILLYHIEVLKKTVTYGNLAKSIKTTPDGGQLAKSLCCIAEQDYTDGKPLSTAIVIREDTGLPGTGFFTQCRKLGFQIDESRLDELVFWNKLINSLGVSTISNTELSQLGVLGAAFGVPIDPGKQEIQLLSSLLTPEFPPRVVPAMPWERPNSPTVAVPVKGTKTVLIPSTHLKKGDLVHTRSHSAPLLVTKVSASKSKVSWQTTDGLKFSTPIDQHLKITVPERLEMALALSAKQGLIRPYGDLLERESASKQIATIQGLEQLVSEVSRSGVSITHETLSGLRLEGPDPDKVD